MLINNDFFPQEGWYKKKLLLYNWKINENESPAINNAVDILVELVFFHWNHAEISDNKRERGFQESTGEDIYYCYNISREISEIWLV